MRTTWEYNANDREQRRRVRQFNAYTLGVAFVILMAMALVLSVAVMLLDTKSPDFLVFMAFLGRATVLNVLMVGLLTLAILSSLGRQSVKVDIHLDSLTVAVEGNEKHVYTVAYADIKKIYIDTLSKSALWRAFGGGYIIMVESVRESEDGGEIKKNKRRYNFPMMESLEEAMTVVAFIEDRRQKAKNS